MIPSFRASRKSERLEKQTPPLMVSEDLEKFEGQSASSPLRRSEILKESRSCLDSPNDRPHKIALVNRPLPRMTDGGDKVGASRHVDDQILDDSETEAPDEEAAAEVQENVQWEVLITPDPQPPEKEICSGYEFEVPANVHGRDGPHKVALVIPPMSTPVPPSGAFAENELDRTQMEMDQMDKAHEDAKMNVVSDCDKEIDKIVAQIRGKCDSQLKEIEAEPLPKKQELAMNRLEVSMKMLDCPPGSEAYRRGCKDVRHDHDFGGGTQASALTSNRESSGTADILQSALPLLLPNGSAPQVLADSVHLRNCRRRPYHGWIGGEGEGEEEAEMVQLAPALLPKYLKLNSSAGLKSRGRGASAGEGGM